MDISNPANKTQRLWQTAFKFSLFLGLLISLSDALVIMPYEVPEVTTFLRTLEPLAAKLVMVAALYMILWFLLPYLLGRALKLDIPALSVSLAVLLMAAYVLYMAHSTLGFGSLPEKLRISMLLSASLLMVLVFSAAAYFVTKLVSQSKWRPLITAICLAIPLLQAETLVMLLANKCLLEPLPSQLGLLWNKLFSPPVLITNIVCLIGIVVTFAIFVRIRRGRALVKVFYTFALLIFASSLLAWMPGSERTLVSKANVYAGHPVKRVILIVSDTLRSDALSCYGGRRISTPHIDRLAVDSILFEKAFAPAPWTSPSVASIMTGVSPLAHMTTDYKSILPDTLLTLAEYMSRAGYLTQAIGSNPMLVRKNFSKGFMSYNFFPKRQDPSLCGKVLSKLAPKKFGYASTTDLTQLAIDWLNPNADNDFFLLVYYYDPHVPYTPPTEYTPDRKPPQGMGTSFSAHVSARSGYLPLTLEQREWVRALYDSEVSYVDDNVGLLLDHLKKLKIYDDALIILTSDHGEEFWEHDGYEHGHTLYNELLSVPLIIKLPGSLLKTTLSQPILIESIMPTILDLCRIDYNRDYISRGSLVPTWSANPNTDNVEPIVSTAPLYYEDRISVIFNGLKYIRSLVTGRQELYNLIEDPTESINIAYTSAAEIEKAKEILNKHQSSAENLKKHYFIEKAQQKELDPETRRQLKSLGYVQ